MSEGTSLRISRRELLLSAAALSSNAGAEETAWENARISKGQSALDVSFSPGAIDAGRSGILSWIQRATDAVTIYFGRFPVPAARIEVTPVDGRHGAFGGVTYPRVPALTRINVGRQTTMRQLERDWIMTHELVHMAFPSVPDRHHWIEEGMATYVEPFARLHAAQLSPRAVWGDMVRGMPKGQPGTNDRGLDNTHTWGRTYWGGALFCLVADVRIRKATSNRLGLQHALRGILQAGGNIQVDWPVERALRAGDTAIGEPILASLHREMGESPITVPLDDLWSKLGVVRANGAGEVTFDDDAPMAAIRRAMDSPA